MIDEGQEWSAWDTYKSFKEISADPRTPETNYLRLYAKDSGGVSTLFYKDDAGNVKNLSGGLTGSGTANRLAYWSAPTVLAANAALTQNRLVTADANGLPSSIGALTSTRIPFSDSNGLPTDSANLFWDNTNFAVTVRASASVVRGFVSEHYQASTDGGLFYGKKARGTSGSPAAIAADDVIVAIGGAGYTSAGSFGGTTVTIRMFGAEGFTGTQQGSYLTLETTPTGSVTRAERFRVGPAGQWGIGGANFGSAGQYFRSGGASAAPTWATIDHGSEVGGLTDDDHTQYALLAGRSGGQVLIGGTASGNDLTLQSTSNATRGHVFFGSGQASGWDDVNLRLGIRTTAPSYPIEVSGAVAEAGGVHIATTHTADGSFGLSVQPTFTPTNTGTIERGVFCFPQFNPGSSVTITRAEVLEFALRTGNGAGAITDLQGVVIGSAGYGTIKPTTVSGAYFFDIGGAGVTTAQCIFMTLPSAATNNVYMGFSAADATDPTGGGGAAAGRLPILVAGTLRYLPYY